MLMELQNVIRQLKIAGFYLRDVECVDTQVLKKSIEDAVAVADSLIPEINAYMDAELEKMMAV